MSFSSGSLPDDHLVLESIGQALFFDFEIVQGLKVHPEMRFHAEMSGQPQGGISRDGAFSMHDFVDPARRNAEVLGEAIL